MFSTGLAFLGQALGPSRDLRLVRHVAIPETNRSRPENRPSQKGRYSLPIIHFQMRTIGFKGILTIISIRPLEDEFLFGVSLRDSQGAVIGSIRKVWVDWFLLVKSIHIIVLYSVSPFVFKNYHGISCHSRMTISSRLNRASQHFGFHGLQLALFAFELLIKPILRVTSRPGRGGKWIGIRDGKFEIRQGYIDECHHDHMM